MTESIFKWLDDSVGALAKKVLSALGIGWVSFNGISQLAEQAKESVLNAWGGMPADVLQIASLAGFGTAVGIIISALMYRASLAAIGHLGRLVTGTAS